MDAKVKKGIAGCCYAIAVVIVGAFLYVVPEGMEVRTIGGALMAVGGIGALINLVQIGRALASDEVVVRR